MSERMRFHLGRLLAAITLLMAAGPLSNAAAPPAPINPVPNDGVTSQPVTMQLRWETDFTTPTLTPVAHPNVLFYTAHTLATVTSGTVNAIRSSFTDFTPSYTTSSDTSTLVSLLADKQAFIVPVQPSSSAQQMAAFGAGIGPVLRQFVESGGLVIVTDASGTNGSTEFLAGAGLMNATFNASYTSAARTVGLASSHLITQDLPTTFTARFNCTYSSVGDAQILVAESITNKPVVAIKSIGAGHVLLIGWPYTVTSSEEPRLLANAVRDLSLSTGTDFESFDVFFGTANPPTSSVASHIYAKQCLPGALAYSTDYYWKVVAHNSSGDEEGPVWSFRTGPSPMPTAPSQPNPPDAGSWIPKTTRLTWKAGAYATSYSVRFGTSNPPTEVTTVTQTNYSPGPLADNTTYYWQVTSHNETGEAAGPVWSFTTQSAPGAPTNPDPADDATSVAITTKLRWDSGTPDTTHTVQIAFFTAHADLANEYPHTLAAIRKFAPDFQATDINAEDTPTLAAALVGKDAFVMIEQENWTSAAMGTYGTKAGPVLKQFAQNGGLVVVLDHDPYGGSANFLNSSGLMSVGTTIRSDYIMVTTYGSNPIIQGLPYYFGVAHGSASYNGVEGQAFLWNYSSPYYPVASMKAVGSGNVLLLGWDYDTWTNEQGMVLANAVKMLPAVNDESYDVYFGTTNPPTTKLQDHTLLTELDPGALDYSTTYYWQVVAHNAAGDTAGPVWSFRSADPPAPDVPSNPTPADNATNIHSLVRLSWSAGSIPATFSIKVGPTNPPTMQIATGLTEPTFVLPPLDNGVTCYWQVIATNSTGSTAGPVWSFSTPPLPSTPIIAYPYDGSIQVPVHTDLGWNASAATSFDVYFGTDNPPTTKLLTTTNIHCTLNALNYETTYYWRIIAINDNGSTSGPVWSFRTVDMPLPTAPSTPTPANQATLIPVSTGLSWSAGSIPATFSVKLGTTNPPTTQIASGLTQPSFNPAGLSLNTTYYWQVTATNKTGSTDGPIWSFSTPPLPTTPVYTFPENGDTTHQLNVSLWWEPSTAGNTFVRYDVYIGTTNPPTTKIVSDTGSGYCDAWMLYTFDYGTTYYWQVVAHNTYGSTNGPVWSFTTEKRPKPGRPSSPSPGNLALVVPTTTTLSWSAATNAASYSVRLDTKNPPEAQVATGLTATSFKPATLSEHTTYYWQVTATNSSGSTDGPVWSFTTTPTPTLNNPLPANGATGVGLTPQLQWNTTTDTVKVLAFTGHINTGSTSRYQKTLSAIRENFTNFTLTETTSETAAALQAQLIGKQVFLIPNQDSWTEAGMGTFGTNAGPVIKQFVQGGGMLIVLDCIPNANSLLANAGLMNITSESNAGGYQSGIVKVWNGITEGVSPDGFYPIEITAYTSIGDAQSLLRTGYSYTYSGMAFKRIGAGSVLASGMGFGSYKKEAGQLIANAIKNHPTATYDVYFGTTNPPTAKKASGIDVTHWSPGTLNYSTNYYWRVVAHNGYGDTTGPVWSFRTMNLPAPAAPSSPNPANKQVFVATTAKLSWATPAIPATFSVKFGTTNPPTTQIANGIATSSCSPGTMVVGTTYYWQVTATNASGKTVGPVWSFSTPGLAHAPVALGPLDKAKNVPINTPLRWDTNSTFTLPVQILTWKNMDGRVSYDNMLAAVRTKYTNFVITETATTDPSTLASQLVGKHVFLMPSHDLWPTSMGTFGANVGTVLKQFVQAGGMVIMCDYSPSSGVVPFLNSAGLMSVTANAAINNSTLRVVDAAHIVNRGVASTFVSSLDTVTYAGVGDAQVLIKQNTTGKPVVAYKPNGAGGVLLLGWNYYQSSSNMAIVLANAIRYLGGAGAGVEHYDVYFGTSNPPTTKLSQGNTYDTFCNSPALQYGKTYYWRVVVHNVLGDKVGPVWSFTATARTGVESREWLRYR